MNEPISDTYEALGMQGVFERFGSSGVRRILADWRCRQREMTINEMTRLSVGAAFCFAFAGGDCYRQTSMGVSFGIMEPSRSGGVFTMRSDAVPYFKEILERVASQDRFREGSGQTMRIPISNQMMAVRVADEILISRSGLQAPRDVITIDFGTRSVTVDRRQLPKLKSLVDQAVDDVDLYREAEERGKRVIARNQMRHASNLGRP